LTEKVTFFIGKNIRKIRKGTSMVEEQFKAEAKEFLHNAFMEMTRQGFFFEPHWHVDHICYRTSTEENYQATVELLSSFSTLLAETQVNGRMISTFKLEESLCHDGWDIDLIEIPAPKKGRIHKDGFEHLEVVSDLSFLELKERYHSFTKIETGLKKNFNPELEFVFSDFAVKFHSLSLESVIHIEENIPLCNALSSLNLLERLRAFDPLIAGSFPLNLQSCGSDVDILLDSRGALASFSHDSAGAATDDTGITETSIFLTELFHHFDDFQIKHRQIDRLPVVVASFAFQGILFEIFAQPLATVKQNAWRHLLAEERILKFGGRKIHQRLKDLRDQGFKTEKAFAFALHRHGDPFYEMLQLQKVSNAELKNLCEDFL
jgi:predicted metalloenzyme YecM